MKSELILHNKETEALKYPLLARYKNNDGCPLVVLFESQYVGTVVYVSESMIYKLGYYSRDWVSCLNEQQWEILPKNSQIILTVD